SRAAAGGSAAGPRSAPAPLRSWRTAADELLERKGDLLQREHEVDHARLLRRPGHAGELGALPVLDDHRPAHLLDRLHAHRAVAAGAGKYHGDCALAVRRGGRLE